MKSASWIVISAVLLFSLAGCANGIASDASVDNSRLDQAAERVSDNGIYTVRYQSDLEPAAINQMHSWVLHIETADGEPVEQAQIRVEGAMPEHGHGLPTQPEVTRELGGGDYRVEGVKYSMPGWWTMTFEISAAGQTDMVTFNLVLE